MAGFRLSVRNVSKSGSKAARVSAAKHATVAGNTALIPLFCCFVDHCIQDAIPPVSLPNLFCAAATDRFPIHPVLYRIRSLTVLNCVVHISLLLSLFTHGIAVGRFSVTCTCTAKCKTFYCKVHVVVWPST